MNPSILLAEDDADLCDLHATLLTSHGYQVATAADGLDCLKQLRESNPDVLILDEDLLWGGGAGILAWLRHDRAHSLFPVILTGTSAHSCNLAREDGPPVVDCLPKPFRLPTLLAAIRSAVQHPSPTALEPRFSSEHYLG